MAAAFAFLGMLLISLVVALLAALQLGDFFGANDEFGLVILGVTGFTVFALLVFALAYAVARRAAVLTFVALALAAARASLRWRCRAGPDDRRSLDQSLHGGRREHLHHAGTGDSRAAGRAGAMGAGAAALAAGRRRGRSHALALDHDRRGRARHPQSVRAGVSPGHAATLRRRFHVGVHRDGDGSRPCRAARDGLDRMLYQGPHPEPALAASPSPQEPPSIAARDKAEAQI